MADQKKVVFEYIEALLTDAPGPQDAATLEAPDPGNPARKTPLPTAERDVAEAREAAAEAQPAEQAEAEMAPDFEAEPENEPESAMGSEPEPEPESQPDLERVEVESEAEFEFEAEPEPAGAAAIPWGAGQVLNCILLDMHGMKLAIDFDRIEGALNFRDLALEIRGLPEWVLGSFGDAPRCTRVVDTARWLIPERYQPEHAMYEEVVILQGRDWALACDGLVKSLQIPLERVNPNPFPERRPWLLGTFMAERCAILDVDQLIQGFEAASG